MKIALAGAKFRNRDVAFNLSQITAYMKKAKEQGARLVCFGEAFLQGFDALTWSYEHDRDIAVSTQSDVFAQLLSQTRELGIDLLFGFLERDGDCLYSSCALLANGRIGHLYRRVSLGWKEYTITDEHYREGDSVTLFDYHGHKCLIALCGDLWDTTASLFMQNADILFWPVYVNFTQEDWYGEANEREAYMRKAAEFGGHVLRLNCVDEPDASSSPALGGCYHYADGEIKAEWPLGSEGMLLADI